MTEKQWLERIRQALARFDALPPKEQARLLIEAGIVNEKGEVLFGRPKEEQRHRPADNGRSGPT